MPARLVALLMLVLTGLFFVGAASARLRGHASRARTSLTVKIPLPRPAESAVELLAVTATAAAGREVGSLSVKSTNAAQLPTGIRSVAAIMPPRSSKHKATFRIFILINNLTGRSAATAAGAALESISATSPNLVQETFTEALLTGRCGALIKVGDVADTEAPRALDVVALEPVTQQPSDPEAVLDNVIYSECPGAEVPEPGPA